MKVLTAGRGSLPEDFARAVAGEVVYLAPVCGRDEDGDRGCGCRRAFTGLASNAPTTVALVADLELTITDLAAMVTASLAAAGWDADEADAVEVAEEIVGLAEEWPEGTRLRRDLDDVEPE